MICHLPELTVEWDGGEAAGSDDFHLCFGGVSGSGSWAVVGDSSIGRVADIAAGVVVETVGLASPSIVDSVQSLLAVAVIVDYTECVDTAVVHAVFACLAVAEVCNDMDSAGGPVLDIVGSEAACNVAVVYTESLEASSLAVGTICYFVCSDPIPLIDGAAKTEKNYDLLESLWQETDCKDMVVVWPLVVLWCC